MVHVKNEYDYRYESDFRKEIFEAIKYVYWKAHGKNIKVFGINASLKDHHTTKKDIAQAKQYEVPN